MDIANKLVTVAENVNKVYEAGYNKAESENPFYYATRLDNVMGGKTFPENYEAVIKLQKAPAYCAYLFNNCRNLKSVKMISEDQSNVVDFTSICSVSDPAYGKLELVDLSEFNKQFKAIHISFRHQSKLKNILGEFNLSNCTASNAVTNAFANCSSLEYIRFVPNTIPISISFSDCQRLTHDSLMSIINGLAVVETTQTLTLHTNLKILQSQVDSANAKGWTIAGGKVVSEEEYYE